MLEAYPLGRISYYVVHTLNSQGNGASVTSFVFQYSGSIIEYVPEEKGEGIQSYLHNLYGLYQYSKHF